MRSTIYNHQQSEIQTHRGAQRTFLHFIRLDQAFFKFNYFHRGKFLCLLGFGVFVSHEFLLQVCRSIFHFHTEHFFLQKNIKEHE